MNIYLIEAIKGHCYLVDMGVVDTAFPSISFFILSNCAFISSYSRSLSAMFCLYCLYPDLAPISPNSFWASSKEGVTFNILISNAAAIINPTFFPFLPFAIALNFSRYFLGRHRRYYRNSL